MSLFLNAQLAGRLVAVLVLVHALLFLPATSTDRALAQVAGGATLTVLEPPVEVQEAATGIRRVGQSGEALQVGDRLIVGAEGSGLVTFFDGSEVHRSIDGGFDLAAGGGTRRVATGETVIPSPAATIQPWRSAGAGADAGRGRNRFGRAGLHFASERG